MLFARPLVVLGLTVLASTAGVLMPSDAAAQQIFRSVGPDGRITFSDRPLGTASGPKTAAVATAPAGSLDISALPFELRQAATSYPVTLFSGPECAPCVQGRTLLTGRGIPFSEKTVSTNEDIESLKRLVGVATLPVLAIGPQQLKGYSEVEWGQFLDAAGYPKTSQLPPAYRLPPATPLVAAHDAKPAARLEPSANAAPVAPALPPAPPENGGIRF
jgi:glutaredoxin